ncbi:MAG: hypothetical protein QXH58_01895 [Nitrososphaerales archaeon]
MRKVEPWGDIWLKIQKPSGELSIKESLSWAFNIYRKNFVMFFIPVVIVTLLSGIYAATVSYFGIRMLQLLTGATFSEAWDWFLGNLEGLLFMIFTLGVVIWIIGTIGFGVCVKCASDLLEKGSASLRNAFSLTLKKSSSLLASVLVAVVLIWLGMFALIIPGVIFAIILSLVVPVIIVENLGATDSLSRSRRLVSNRWLKSFTFYLIIMILVAIVFAISSLIVTPIGAYSLPVSNILAGIITGFIAPIVPIATTVYYYSMIAREQQKTPPSSPT